MHMFTNEFLSSLLRYYRTGVAALLLLCAWLYPEAAHSQERVGMELAQRRGYVSARSPLGRPSFRAPYAHPRYIVELEPHGLLQWAYTPVSRSDVGIGLGFRASIPVLANGPIPQINNNLAVTFGFDWAHFSGCRPDEYDCGVNDFWFPFAMQWNFFLTQAWSVFPEVGFAVHHAAWSWDGPARGRGGQVVCGPGPDAWCEYSDSYTRVAFVTWLGTRFSLSDMFSFTLRVGVPSLVAGVSFRL